jgi:hypothetical protein
MASTTLQARLRHFARRLFAIGITAGVGWGLAAAAALLVICAWLDLLWELPPGLRVASSAAALVVTGLLVLAAGWLARRGSRPKALARRLDQLTASGGQILSGVDLALEQRPAAPLTTGLADLAVRRAAELAGRIPGPKAAPARPVYWSFGSVGFLGAAVTLAVLGMPRLAWTQWLRFTDPYGDHPPYSRVLFHVEPGDVQVVYGAGLEIRVTTEGALVDRLDLVLHNDGAAGAETLPLFPEPGGEWRASLANVTSAGRYFIRSHAGRSRAFRIGVITVPRLEGVRFRITPPAYTNRAAYEGPLPQGGLAGLPGTRVQVWAKSNRPLAGGSLEFTGPAQAAPVALAPVPSESQEATGTFEIRKRGKFLLKVIDTDGQPSADAFAAPIAVLTDERPFIRILEPPAQSLATPSASLPVVLAAEDDYGISRIQLFRSLNDSRALPLDVPVPTPAPTRWSATLSLPLHSYELTPGDEIKLFARVEDNDPAGPKGSESAIVVVRIIAQEDFERLVRARQGMEVFLSKYREAQRRLEDLANEVEQLQKKLAALPPESEAAKEMREELRRLTRKMQAQAEALRKSAQKPLPYDLDKALSRHLDRMGEQLEQLARESEALASRSALTAGELAKALAKMRKQLAGQQEELNREAVEPLEYVAAVYRLLEDAARFTALYQQQQDLAKRLESLKGRDRADDPALKSRMRDLQAEQQQIRNALAQLLDDIEDHAAKLPDEPQLQDLRQTALDLARDVRGSGAAEAMAEAESALADFAGTRGHEAAGKAEAILEKFIGRCQGGLGTQAGQACLKFKPSLSEGLGNTLGQLLAEAGLPSGDGSGAGDGFSSRRGTLDNVGLYGNVPALGSGTAGEASRQNWAGPARGVRGGRIESARPSSPDADAKRGAAGAADAVVPGLYRRRVAEYFQRVADETGGK